MNRTLARIAIAGAGLALVVAQTGHAGGQMTAPRTTKMTTIARIVPAFDEEKTIIVTTHQIEEIEHILTDLLFIRDGKIVLDATMEQIGERFCEVMVNPDKADAARALKPLHERQIFGKTIFLFDGIDQKRLAELGELHKPSVADLFVATMKGTYQ